MTVFLEVLLSKINDKKLTIKLYKHHNQEDRIAERFNNYSNVEFIYCDTYKETIENSDVIVSAVTRVTDNFCDDACYKEGCTVIPIMTMGFQNCDLFFDKVYTDEIDQIKGFKYFDKFKYVANTTDVFKGIKEGRENNKERILIYYYGLAIIDLYFAYKILQQVNDVKEVEYNYCKEKYFI